MAFCCSAQRFFRLSRRFDRALIVFFAFVKSKIVGQQPEDITLRNANCDVAFLKMERTDYWIDLSLEFFVCSLT